MAELVRTGTASFLGLVRIRLRLRLRLGSRNRLLDLARSRPRLDRGLRGTIPNSQYARCLARPGDEGRDLTSSPTSSAGVPR